MHTHGIQGRPSRRFPLEREGHQDRRLDVCVCDRIHVHSPPYRPPSLIAACVYVATLSIWSYTCKSAHTPPRRNTVQGHATAVREGGSSGNADIRDPTVDPPIINKWCDRQHLGITRPHRVLLFQRQSLTDQKEPIDVNGRENARVGR